MRTAARSAVLLLFLLPAACDQVEPVIVAVSMPDCTYRGPAVMREGVLRLSLTLNGLGRARVLLVELEDHHTYDEVEKQFEQSADWDSQPDWLRPVIDLELSDAQGVAGSEESERLAVGQYAVICVDEGSGGARAASPLEVRGS